MFANPIISIAGPGLDAPSHEAAVRYLYVLAPVAFLAAVNGILYSLCQAEDLFAAIAIGAFVGTVTTFVIMLMLWGSLNLMALAVGDAGRAARRRADPASSRPPGVRRAAPHAALVAASTSGRSCAMPRRSR